MKSLTKAYLLLLSIFCVVLIVGSVKATIYPDETVYAPGKLVVLYDPETQQALKAYNNTSRARLGVTPSDFKAYAFNESFLLQSNYCK
ncbi:MAG TPA: hypothetical protein VIT68_04075 [Candidatus Gracilibacteria bacterium]